MTKKIAFGLSLIVLAALLGGLYWFNWLFEADDAELGLDHAGGNIGHANRGAVEL